METELLKLIQDCKQYLDDESINETLHFYEHGEYEMSLEGLLIEMIKAQRYPDMLWLSRIEELIIYYCLRQESVFDYNFADKFDDWYSKWQEQNDRRLE